MLRSISIVIASEAKQSRALYQLPDEMPSQAPPVELRSTASQGRGRAIANSELPFLLPSRLREGLGVGEFEFDAKPSISSDWPTPNPSRKREGDQGNCIWVFGDGFAQRRKGSRVRKGVFPIVKSLSGRSNHRNLRLRTGHKPSAQDTSLRSLLTLRLCVNQTALMRLTWEGDWDAQAPNGICDSRALNGRGAESAQWAVGIRARHSGLPRTCGPRNDDSK